MIIEKIFNLSLLYSQAYIMLLLRFWNLIMYNYVDKKWFITDLLRFKSRRKGFIYLQYGFMYALGCRQSPKSSSILGQLYPEAVLSQQPKSRSEKNARVDVNSIASFHKRGGTLISSLLMYPRVKKTGSLSQFSMSMSAIFME